MSIPPSALVTFLLGLRLPFLNGGWTINRAAFIPDDGMLGKALRQGFGVTCVFGGEIGGDGFGKFDRHKHSPLSLLKRLEDRNTFTRWQERTKK
jgi:hypothetical protein